jgi:hypothetical protein
MAVLSPAVLPEGGVAAVHKRNKKALLFEKRSKNFGLFAHRLYQHATHQKQKFFGSFLQKRTLSWLYHG